MVKKHLKLKVLCSVLSAAIMVGSALPVGAAGTQDQIDSAKAQRNQASQRAAAKQSEINKLESLKNDSEAYLTELGDQLDTLTGELQDLRTEYENTQLDIEVTKVELGAANLKSQKQSEDMKLRIQYMYENTHGTGFLTNLFSANSFLEFLNKSEFITSVDKFDKEKMAEYEETQQEIAEKKEALEQQQESITELQVESLRKQDEVKELYDSTNAQIEEYAASITDAESDQAQLLAEVQSRETELNALMAQKAEEDAVKEAEQAAAAEKQAAEEQAAAAQAAEIQAPEEEAVPEEPVVQEEPAEDAPAEEAVPEETGQEDISVEEPEETYVEEETYEEEEDTEVPTSTYEGGGFYSYVPAEDTDDIENSATYRSVQSVCGWSGAVLTKSAGVVTGPAGRETYYNLPMNGVVRIMRNAGNNDPYWVRSDGVKMLGNYVMVAANHSIRPRGSIYETSLGLAIVCDTGSFISSYPEATDIAVSW